MLFSMVHAGVAWRISGWWPAVLTLPPSDPRRNLFSIDWWPPMRALGEAASGAGAPAGGGISNLMLLPLDWLTCFVSGWLTAIASCLPFRLRRRR
ncbi:hypothetical protein [Tautonia sociabilis]|uniref:Uncharacterized protein n=1 Tax=Tautonia sociabilis TaxID=2080755 RepID=A0A432MGM9_9BACT|nr:hypothetical protein [Tautonia sociabilis]RUL85946.1 hypothetical protein TsocGM_17415 [Tautonia sociabilis]